MIQISLEYFSSLAFYFLLSYVLYIIYSHFFVILWKKFKLWKSILKQDDKPIFFKLHKDKIWTLTMWGIVITLAIASTIVISRAFSYYWFIESSLLNRSEVYLPLFTLVVLSIIGMIDDYINIRKIEWKDWLLVSEKTILLLIFSIIWAFWFFFKLEINGLSLPHYWFVEIGMFYIPLFIFVIFATSNAVNITDGIDGLAWWLLIIAYSIFWIIAFLKWLVILSLFCMIVVASLLWYLWFNVPPAKYMMGDTWSLSLGWTLAVIAMMTDSLIVLPIVWAVFFAEEASSFVQIMCKKLGIKKPFKIAPFHHHLEAIWWERPQITMRLWIVGILCGISWLLISQLII